MIYDKGWWHGMSGEPLGETPRDVADHFVWCVALVHYFLFGYLYSVKKHYEAGNPQENKAKIKFWNGMEVRCQLGIFLSYYLVWMNNQIVCYFVGFERSWNLFSSETALYKYMTNKSIISNRYAWGEKYWNSFVLCLIIAPIILAFLIYSVHLVYRIIQFKHNDCLSILWAIRNVALLIAAMLLAVRWFQLSKFDEYWNDIFWYGYNMVS